MAYYLDFEKPIEVLERRFYEIRKNASKGNINIDIEIKQISKNIEKLLLNIFSNLTPWQKTLIARHPDRPHAIDYISLIAEDIIELHGDRRFRDDPAILSCICKINNISMLLIGYQKGKNIKDRILKNFGQPHPEGYRKSLRLMQLAERFKMPIITLIDTPGAYPGIGSEERGQAEAIAFNIMEMARLNTPIISIVIGEGGSGGALALSIADILYMLEYSVFSVISPEGCAAILWKKGNKQLSAEDFSKSAEALKVTTQDLYSMKVIDGIIPEPLGAAHRNPEVMAKTIHEYILKGLETLKEQNIEDLIKNRYKKLRYIGANLNKEVL